MSKKPLPRGIRNNNPGNIDRTTDRWLGMSADQSGDSRFVVFNTPEHGIRALLRVLINYQERHGLWTLRGIIDRWAPPVENNTSAYVMHASRLSEFDPDERIDMLDKDAALRVAKAIVRHECGDPALYGQPADWFLPGVWERAAVLAGYDPETKPLAKSRTIAGTATATAATIAGAVYEAAGEVFQTASESAAPLSAFGGELFKYGMLALALFGLFTAIRARLDDQKRRLT